jgi:hypothetical protein
MQAIGFVVNGLGQPETMLPAVQALGKRHQGYGVRAELSRLSGAQVRWLNASGERPVSVDFTALPLDEALRRLLDPYNFVLLYTADGERSALTQIWISAATRTTGQSDPTLRSAALSPHVAAEAEEEWEETEARFPRPEDENLHEQRMEAEYRPALLEDREWTDE